VPFSLSSVVFLSLSFEAMLAISLSTFHCSFSLCFTWFSSATNSIFCVVKIGLIILFQLLQPAQFCVTFKIGTLFFLSAINQGLSSLDSLSKLFYLLRVFCPFRSKRHCLF